MKLKTMKQLAEYYGEMIYDNNIDDFESFAKVLVLLIDPLDKDKYILDYIDAETEEIYSIAACHSLDVMMHIIKDIQDIIPLDLHFEVGLKGKVQLAQKMEAYFDTSMDEAMVFIDNFNLARRAIIRA